MSLFGRTKKEKAKGIEGKFADTNPSGSTADKAAALLRKMRGEVGGTPIYNEPIPATGDTVGVASGSDASSATKQKKLFYLVQVKREGDIADVLVLTHPDSDFVPGIINLPKTIYENIRNEIRPENCGKDKTWIRVAGIYAERFYGSVRAYSPEALIAEVPDWKQNLRP